VNALINAQRDQLRNTQIACSHTICQNNPVRAYLSDRLYSSRNCIFINFAVKIIIGPGRFIKKIEADLGFCYRSISFCKQFPMENEGFFSSLVPEKPEGFASPGAYSDDV